MAAILVTCGAGYVGSHCCKHSHRAGFIPVVVDNLDTGHRDFVRWGPFQQGDIRDQDFVLGVIDRHKPVAAMHFAAKSLVSESVQAPDLFYDNNVGGALTLLECPRDGGAHSPVFSSTWASAAPGRRWRAGCSAGRPTIPVSRRLSPSHGAGIKDGSRRESGRRMDRRRRN